MLPSIALAVCISATGVFGPSPTLWWDASLGATSYDVYQRVAGEAFHRADADCWHPCWEDMDATVCDTDTWICRGVVIGIPVVRASDLEDQDVEWCVSASNAEGESACSTSVVVCMPRIWHPGIPYDYGG